MATTQGISWGIGRSGQLVPDLDEVAVRVAREEIRLAGHELSLLGDRAARATDAFRGVGDVARIREAESEVGDAAFVEPSRAI
jgi:hypothetical protein